MSDKPRNSGFASERESAGPKGFGAGLGMWKDAILGARRQPEESSDSTDSDSDSSIERKTNESKEATEEEEMEPTTAVNLDKLSGLPKRSKFATGTRERTEQYEV